jgi:hypothetical protein
MACGRNASNDKHETNCRVSDDLSACLRWSSEFCAGQKSINIAQINAILFT